MCSDCWVTTTTTYVRARGALLLCASAPRVPDRLQAWKNRESESGRVDGTAEAAGFPSILREGRGPQPRRPLLLPPRDGGTVPAATRVVSTDLDLDRSTSSISEAESWQGYRRDKDDRRAGPGRAAMCAVPAYVRRAGSHVQIISIYLSCSPHCRPDQALDRAVSMCPSCTFSG